MLEVSFETNESRELELTIYNSVGKAMLASQLQVQDGTKQTFDVKQFSEGIYFLEIKTKEGLSQTMKFIKI